MLDKSPPISLAAWYLRHALDLIQIVEIRMIDLLFNHEQKKQWVLGDFICTAAGQISLAFQVSPWCDNFVCQTIRQSNLTISSLKLKETN